MLNLFSLTKAIGTENMEIEPWNENKDGYKCLMHAINNIISFINEKIEKNNNDNTALQILKWQTQLIPLLKTMDEFSILTIKNNDNDNDYHQMLMQWKHNEIRAALLQITGFNENIEMEQVFFFFFFFF